MKKKSSYLAFLLILFCNILIAQRSVSGKVTDNNNMPLPEVNVIIKGTQTGTTTDFNGFFSVKINNNLDVIEFSYLGYKTLSIVVGNQTAINVKLEEDNVSLDEVIVSAQGIKKSKKALGYAITKIDSEDIEQRPEADLAQNLSGKIAGVDITTSSGQTGAVATIRIRGNNSITASNAPLVVLNNVPFAGTIRDIDPNDIESLSVLKGLNASVLYGSAGRNGVLLIQTKSGNATLGKTETKTTFSTTSYFNQVSQLPEYQNLYGQGQEKVFIPTFYTIDGPAFSSLDEVMHPFSHLTSIFPEYEGVMVPYTAKPNNVRNFFKTGLGKIHSLSISTSREKVAFNLSAGYTDEEGIIGDNNLKRFNLGVGGSAQVNDKLNISSTLNYSTRKVNIIDTDEVFRRIFYLARNIDLTELPYQNPLTGASVHYLNDTNPIWILNNTGNNDDITRVFGTFNANYQLSNDLNLTYRVGYDSEHVNSFDYSNKGGYGGFNNEEYRLGYLNLLSIKEVVVDQTFILGINRALANNFNLDAQVGVNSKLTKSQRFSSASSGQIVYDFLRPNNFSSTETTYSTTDQNLAGVFGQLQFDYSNYLFATLSARNDWGSTVEKDNQSMFYPGASLSFIPTSVFDFMKNNRTINYLKLRAAYATSSGYPEPYRTRNTFIIDPLRFAAADGSFPVTNRFSSIFANPDLKPELHKEFEIGLESKFFNNRVTLETSLYKRISEDQIVQSNMPISSAFNTQFINVGRVDNKGIEVELGIQMIKNSAFKWNLRNIFTADKSLVVKTTPTGGDIRIQADRWAIEGYPFGTIKGNYAVRDEDGNYLINGNGGDTRQGEVINSSLIGLDDKILGDPNPDWRLTNINTFSYKNFTLSAQIDYTHGGEIHSLTVQQMIERGVTRNTENRDGSFVVPGFLADSQTGELFLDANGNKIPNNIQLGGIRTVFSNYYDGNDQSMWDTSTFRIREVSLGYSLNGKTFNLPFKKIDLKLVGRNLWFISPNFPKYVNYDPESSGRLGNSNAPSTKRIALSLTLNF